MFEIIGWAMVGLLAFGMLGSFYYIDRPRPTIGMSVAIFGTIFNGVIIWYILQAIGVIS